MKNQIEKFKLELIDYSNIECFKINRIFEITTDRNNKEICVQNENGIRDFKRVESNCGNIVITEDLT